MTRVACYVDGFNLYHAVSDLGRQHLKWLDIQRLAQSICRPGEILVKTAYFSAYATWLPAPYARHREYVSALKATGVDCHMARFNEKQAGCRSCGVTWKTHEEKETDVHFSLTFLEDAIDNVFDRAILISADGDHVPAVRRVRARCPRNRFFSLLLRADWEEHESSLKSATLGLKSPPGDWKNACSPRNSYQPTAR
jgi:hypothetical protein